MDIEHDCRYAKVIRTQPEWITDDNGFEMCAFCQAPRYIKVVKTEPTRKAK